MSNEQFCDQCGVTNDLHDGPDTCEYAEAKAGILEMFGRQIASWSTR